MRVDDALVAEFSKYISGASTHGDNTLLCKYKGAIQVTKSFLVDRNISDSERDYQVDIWSRRVEEFARQMRSMIATRKLANLQVRGVTHE